jgi:class 3 adenylate cyclase
MPLPEFEPKAAPQQAAVVVSLDMTGFSKFCNQPDSTRPVARLIAYFFDQLDKWLTGEWPADRRIVPIGRPDFSKFTGDGAILIWLKDEPKDFGDEFCCSLVERLRMFRAAFGLEVLKLEKTWKTSGLPTALRVGIATGMVDPLRKPSIMLFDGDVVDYVGYCINLAVRLQDHCPDLGMLVHGNLHIEIPGWKKVKAVKLKNTINEHVYVWEDDFGPYYYNRKGQTDRKFEC